MPIGRAGSWLDAQHQTACSSTTGSLPSYDKPPGPDRGQLSDVDPVLPSRRLSWVDVVERCSSDRTSTITDLSSLADSVSFTNRIVPGQRRRSWDQLVASRERLDVPSGEEPRDVNDSPPLMPVEAERPMHVVAVGQDGRLGRVQLYNKAVKSASGPLDPIVSVIGAKFGKTDAAGNGNGGSSSKTSTVSEFILVPKPSVAFTLSSTSDEDSLASSSRLPGFSKSLPLRPSRPSRRTSFFMLATAVLLLATAIVGYLLHERFSRRTVYEARFLTPTGTSTLKLTFVDASVVHFLLDYDNRRAQTNVDFHRRSMLTRTETNSNTYCFLTELNQTALPNMGSLKKAAANIDGKELAIAWTVEWKWLARSASETERSSLAEEIKNQCGDNLYSLQPSTQNLSNLGCPSCYQICLPFYAVASRDNIDALLPISLQCFWVGSSKAGDAAAVVSPSLDSAGGRFPTSINGGNPITYRTDNGYYLMPNSNQYIPYATPYQRTSWQQQPTVQRSFMTWPMSRQR